MQQKFSLQRILSLLKKSNIVSKIEIISIDEIAGRSVYRIRCSLIPSKYKLEVKFIKTEREFIYSYQLFTDKPIIRWDNAPHYPDIRTYPHHFHDRNGNVIESDLKGIVIDDLNIILRSIKKMLR